MSNKEVDGFLQQFAMMRNMMRETFKGIDLDAAAKNNSLLPIGSEEQLPEQMAGKKKKEKLTRGGGGGFGIR